jgi:RimJ/RimL family protein N-acetyltransferase
MEKLNNPPFRVGRNILLRIPNASDAEVLCAYMNNPSVNMFLSRRMPLSMSQEQEWIASRQDQGPHAFTFVIEHITDEKTIGTIGIHGIDYIHRTATTGTAIGVTEYQKKGLGTEAKMLLLDFAFNVLNLRIIESRVLAYNEGSLKYAKKCAYEKVAELPERYFHNGTYYNEIILDCRVERWRPLWEETKRLYLPESSKEE